MLWKTAKILWTADMLTKFVFCQILYLRLVDKLTSKKCAKTINLLCAGNKFL